MKNLKFLIVFMAGVAFTLLVTGHGPHFSEWSFSNALAGDEFLGVLAVFGLIILTAFLAATWSRGGEGRLGKFFYFLRNFKVSRTDCWLGGICGGLGQRTVVPTWIWRLGFAITFFYYGSGLLAYFLLWIFVPADDGVVELEKPAPSADTFLGFLHHLKRSEQDRWLGGVCGGLAARTGAPVWAWRLGFTALGFCYGSGVAVYVLMWIFVPLDEAENKIAA